MKGSDIHKGMMLKHINGRTYQVLDVLPFGRVVMGQMMDGTPPEGLSGVVSQWEQPKRDLVQQVNLSMYEPIM